MLVGRWSWPLSSLAAPGISTGHDKAAPVLLVQDGGGARVWSGQVVGVPGSVAGQVVDGSWMGR